MLQNNTQKSDEPLLDRSTHDSITTTALDKACRKCREKCHACPRFLNPIPLSVVLLYLLVGTVMYTLVVPLSGPSPHMNVTWIDAAYFSLVTLTTVGYGDFRPGQNDVWCQLFTIFYAIIGVSFLGWALGAIAENAIANVATKSIEGVDGKQESACTDCCRRCGRFGRCWLKIPPVWRNLVITFSVMALLLLLGVAMFAWSDGVSVFEGIYFVVISATTIGYGDESPKTPASKLFAVFWLLIVSNS